MNYIGSKNKLSPWIFDVVSKKVSGNLKEKVFADIFAGTGQVARYFKKDVKKVIVNDLELYSYVLNRHYIGNSSLIDTPSIKIEPVSGIITNNFSPLSEQSRMYFTEDNARLIDGIRLAIEKGRLSKKLTDDQYYWLMCSLIEASDKVANTASVYGAFLKKFKKSAIKQLDFKLVDYELTEQENLVLQGSANDIIKDISGDILYLDPPYNARQYGANYHVLNRIAEYKDFSSEKITGMIDYNKSDYCKKSVVEDVFDDLLKNADFEYIFVSYNNEGLIQEKRFMDIMNKYGNYEIELKEYKRFKADSKRVNKADKTFEHLHCLRKK